MQRNKPTSALGKIVAKELGQFFRAPTRGHCGCWWPAATSRCVLRPRPGAKRPTRPA